MRALYDIDQEIANFEFEIDEETGEITNYADLDNLKMEREQKIEGVALWYKNMLAEKEAVKAEKQNFAEREKKLDNKINNIKAYLSYALNGEKFSTSKVQMSFRKSESVKIPDETKIPRDYCNVTEVVKPDKMKIKEALKNGMEVFGAELVESKNIQIK